MDRRDRAALDNAGQGPTLRFIEFGCIARRLAVDQTGWPLPRLQAKSANSACITSTDLVT
jgi:hypothetical protein